MKDMRIAADRSGRNTFAIPTADSIFTRVLTGAAKTITVPLGAAFAVFSATDDFWMSNGGTAAVPSADSDVSLVELNPAARSVEPGDVLSLIGSCTVVVSFYA